jgi:hypothetical protein
MEDTDLTLEQKESSAIWDSDKGSCSECPCGAAGQNPVQQRADGTPLVGEEHLSSSSQIPENLEGLTEKVGTLGLQVIRKNGCGAAKKRARKAKLAEAFIGDSDGGQPRSASANQRQTLQNPGTSGAHDGRGPVSAEQKSPKSKGYPQSPSKRQRSAGGTQEGGRLRGPTGQLSYARAALQGLRVVIVCEYYPRSLVFREKFADIQRVIGRFVDELPVEAFAPRLVDSYWSKG